MASFRSSMELRFCLPISEKNHAPPYPSLLPMPNGVKPAALSFLASARNSAHVFGPLFGFRPAFLNIALFQMNGMPSRYWGIAQIFPADLFSAVTIQLLISLSGH